MRTKKNICGKKTVSSVRVKDEIWLTHANIKDKYHCKMTDWWQVNDSKFWKDEIWCGTMNAFGLTSVFSSSSSSSLPSSFSEQIRSKKYLYVIGERCFKIYNFDGMVKWAADVNAKRQKSNDETKRNEKNQNKTKPKYVYIAISRQLVH